MSELIKRDDAIQNIHKWFDSSDIKLAVPHIVKCLNEVSSETPSRQVIEDIKADIEETIESYVCDKEENTMKAQGMLNAMRMTFEIIDKHTKGDK